MASIIKTLKTYLTNKTIYPRTVTQAVYDSEGKRLDNILGKADISAISDGTVTGAIAAVSNKADKNEESIITVEAIAKGRNKARVFSTTESMENWLSDSANKGVANVGDNLYIVAVDVPDWWISSVLEAPNESGMYYEIAQLETQKVDLTTIENAINSIDSKIGNTDISAIGDGTVTGGLDALNSNFTWKRVGAEHKGVPISYPSEFNELYVLVDYGMFGVYDEVTVIKNFLNNQRTIQRGSSEKTGFELVFGTNNVKLQWAYIEKQVPENAEITLYYR